MFLCEECQAERDKWLDAIQDLANSWICKPKDREGRYSTKTTPFVPGQRGKRATEIVRDQIRLIEKHCERTHHEQPRPR